MIDWLPDYSENLVNCQRQTLVRQFAPQLDTNPIGWAGRSVLKIVSSIYIIIKLKSVVRRMKKKKKLSK